MVVVMVRRGDVRSHAARKSKDQQKRLTFLTGPVVEETAALPQDALVKKWRVGDGMNVWG